LSAIRVNGEQCENDRGADVRWNCEKLCNSFGCKLVTN
jgi:hypothetical protein